MDHATRETNDAPRLNDERAPTTDAIRVGIDRGQAADKVPFPDPAAAPLGTDDEAGGHPPTAEQRRMAAEYELTQPVPPERPLAAPSQGQRTFGPLMLIGALLVLALVSLVMFGV